MTNRVSKSRAVLFALSVSALLPFGASADGPSQVTWQPSYSSSCEDCSLIGRQMPYSDLTGTHYARANLSHASLFGSVAEDAHFQNITGRYADFSQAQLNNTNLDASILTNARFIGVQANGASFKDAKLDFSIFVDAKLIGANLADVSAMHMSAAGADFSAANATGGVFDHADLRGANFSAAQLFGASFAEANLAGAQFRDARLGGANFLNARNVEQADFTGACRSLQSQLPSGLSLRLCATN